MNLDEATLDFISGPVLLMACATDGDRRPAIGRAMGVIVQAPDTLDLIVSRWQWPQLVANAASSARLALTASRASDYVTYQVKGSALVRDAGAAELDAARHYHAAISEELGRGNVPAWISGQWAADREMVTLILSVAEAYVQTPGPRAGTSL